MQRLSPIALALALALTLAALALDAPRALAEPDPGEGVVYELLPQSELRLDCIPCEIAHPVVALAGRFRLGPARPAAGGEEHALLDIDFRDLEGTRGIRVTGKGIYHRREDGGFSLVLSPELDGQPEVDLSGGGPEDPGSPWPAIAAEAAAEKPGQGIYISSLRLRAVPLRKAEMVPYRLRPESYLLVDCELCKRLVLPIPLDGTFLLGEVQDTPPYAAYRIDCVDFSAARPDLPAGTLDGHGSYVRFEEFAVTESMTLDLRFRLAGEEWAGAVLQSGAHVRGAPFPAIKLDLVQSNSRDPDTIFKIHLEAEPDGPPAGEKFRRGDANDDGRVDISDPVRVLGWLFLGQGAPGCLEAADSNRDRTHDLTDAVFLLGYLFQAGDPPPEPGPAACGTEPEAGAGCALSLSCAP